MCEDKMGWDEPLHNDLRLFWEAWQDHNPSSTVKEVQQYELHHFAEASVFGYRGCAYLRVVSCLEKSCANKDNDNLKTGTLSFCSGHNNK